MRRRTLRIITGIGSATALACLASCTHTVAGSPIFSTQTSSTEIPLVKVTDLSSLIPTAAEAGEVMNASQLATTTIFTTPVSFPDGWLSDPRCAGAVIPVEESTYRGSGYLGTYVQVAKDPYQRLDSAGVVAFGDAQDAHRFVDSAVSRWRDCTDKTFTVTLDGPSANWIASGPNISDGVAVLLSRNEGGRGYGCSRAIADRSNIVADVLVCGPDEAVLNDQAATIVNMILAKIPG